MPVITADVGPADLGEVGDLAQAAHRQLADDGLGAGLDQAERQRQPDLGVVVRGARDRRAGRGASSAARMSLVEVLPVEPVTPTTTACERRRTCAATWPSAMQRVGDHDLALRDRPARRSAPAVAPAARAACGEARAVGARARAARRTGRRARTARESTASRSRRRRAVVSVSQAAAISAAVSAIIRPPRRERLAGDHDVVERQHRVAELLALLVALAGDHDHVAAPGLADRPRDRRAPVGLGWSSRGRR